MILYLEFARDSDTIVSRIIFKMSVQNGAGFATGWTMNPLKRSEVPLRSCYGCVA